MNPSNPPDSLISPSVVPYPRPSLPQSPSSGSLSTMTALSHASTFRNQTASTSASGDLLGDATAYEGSQSTPSVAFSARRLRDWVHEGFRKVARKRGRWSVAFFWWTVVWNVVVAALVVGQMAISVGSFTSSEMVLCFAFELACCYSIGLSFTAIVNQNIFEVCGAIFFSLALFACTLAMAIADTDVISVWLVLNPPSATSPLGGDPAISVDPTAWYSSYVSKITTHLLTTWAAHIHPVQMATSTACGMQLLGQLVFAGGTWREVKWKSFRKIGADRRMQNRYGAYTLLVLVIKLSAFFAVVAGVYTTTFVTRTSAHPPIFYSLDVAFYFAFTLGLFILLWAVRRENLAGVVVFVVLAVAMDAALILQVSKLYPPPPFPADVNFVFRAMGTFFCIFNIFQSLVCIAVGSVCAYDFGHGLQQLLRERRKEREAEYNSQYPSHDTSPFKPGTGGRARKEEMGIVVMAESKTSRDDGRWTLE
ncbi:hypothetical protein M427DRAFT_31136 [Gonapodya prolifera JEL478]|uniref:Uncharacterized protein n=1 Tax=Gonapodya prolifera (strain JEL478) TaxID=1344416 RepID=A0A139AI65_GONPJ|nr:hypothetical protein M427DRAFT_31136 [Gonapodya prolifera JEL478]|eukprot:KXS16399.1 hypothetical protein M427DRAFT_31136 [Gonapodya prolifera JEL478]